MAAIQSHMVDNQPFYITSVILIIHFEVVVYSWDL